MILDDLEKEITEVLIKTVSPYGNVETPENLLIGIRKNLKTDLTKEIILKLFANTRCLYYFKDSTVRNDYYFGSESEMLKLDRIPLCKLVSLSNIPEQIHNYQYLLFFYSTTSLPPDKEYEWKPCYIGSKEYLLSKFCPQLSNYHYSNLKVASANKTINRVNTEFSQDNFLNNIYENLFNKEKWKSENFEYPYQRLYKYFQYLTEAISKKISNGTLNKEYYVKTEKDNTEYILINSRLMNKFGNWIYLSYKVRKYWNNQLNKTMESYVEPTIITNSQMAFNAGYKDILLNNIKPIQFYNSPSELLFDGDINSFDLDDSQHFQHIIEDRGDRLPESFKDKNIMEIVVRFKLCIEYALKMKEMDYNYIVPAYGIERDCIQFLIPFYDEFAPDKLPSGVIVTNKINNKWILNTVLSLSDAYDMARLLAIPATKWI